MRTPTRPIIAVLGSTVRDGEPSPALRSRVAAAAAEWEKSSDDGTQPYIFCLGRGDDVEPEARVMASLLEERGIPRSVLIEEAHSSTTEENLLHLGAILTDPSFPDAWAGRTPADAPDPTRLPQPALKDLPVTLVTSAYHMPRTLLMARHVGFSPQAVTARHPFGLKEILREIGALAIWFGRMMRRGLGS